MKRPGRGLSIIITICLLAFILPGGLVSGLRSFAVRTLSPFLKASNGTAIWVDTRLHNLTHLGSLYQERASLEQRVIELENQVAGLANASHENDLLRQELGVQTKTDQRPTIQATIISRTSADPLGEAIIDQGSSAGIKVGQAVISLGMLVGKISAVNDKTATITFITSPRAQIQAELVDSQALGLVNGSPTGLHLTEIDQGVIIKQGELVQTSGISLDGTMPRGLVVGQVDRVISAAGQSHQEAIIHSPINFNQLRIVFIVTATK